MRRWLKRLLKWAVALVLLPYVLILVYAVDFVRPVSTLMLWDLVTLRGYDRRWVEFEEIAPVLVQSVMVSEDGQFCNHFGVDMTQLKGVVQDALDGESTRGASTSSGTCGPSRATTRPRPRPTSAPTRCASRPYQRDTQTSPARSRTSATSRRRPATARPRARTTSARSSSSARASAPTTLTSRAR